MAPRTLEAPTHPSSHRSARQIATHRPTSHVGFDRSAPARDALDDRATAIAQQLKDRNSAPAGQPWWRHQLTAALLEQTIDNADLVTHALQMIEAVAAHGTADDIAQRVRSCAMVPSVHLPRAVRSLIEHSERSSWATAVVACGARTMVQQMAHRFVAGPDLRRAMTALQRLHRDGLAFTIGRLPWSPIFDPFADGDAGAMAERDPQASQKDFLTLVTALASEVKGWGVDRAIVARAPYGEIPIANVSIKLSSLGAGFEPMDPNRTAATAKKWLRPLLLAAARQNVFVNFDMEQYACKDLTLRIFRELLLEPPLRDYEHFGIALQAYLKDTPRDLEALYRWVDRRGTPVSVRLVKGAFWNYETTQAARFGREVPVYTQKWQTDRQFERLSDRLIENFQQIHPALASHNIASISRALAKVQQQRLPAGAVEFQVLRGVGDDMASRLAQHGQRVRLYMPYGQLLGSLANLMRRLLTSAPRVG